MINDPTIDEILAALSLDACLGHRSIEGRAVNFCPEGHRDESP